MTRQASDFELAPVTPAPSTSSTLIITPENVMEHINRDWIFSERWCARGWYAQLRNDPQVSYDLDGDTLQEAKHDLKRLLLDEVRRGAREPRDAND